MKKISEREKKYIRLFIGAFFCFAVLKWFVFPLTEYYEEKRKEIEMQEQLLDAYLHVLEGAETVERTLARARSKQRKVQQSVFSGLTPAIAAADIQKVIRDCAQTAGITIKSLKVQDAQPGEKLVAVPLKVRFYSRIKKVVQFIQAIETHRKLLTITDMRIRVRNRRRPQRGIRAAMVICGYMKKDERLN